MRYFTYISDAKIDMLLPQIPVGKKQKIVANLGFNIAIMKGGVRAETNTLDTRVTRLLAVERYLRDNEPIGHASDANPWIESNGLFATSLYLEGGAVIWSVKDGVSEVLLVGSATHLAASASDRDVRAPYSELAGIQSLVYRFAPENRIYFDGFESWPDERGHMREDFVWVRNLIDYVDNHTQHSKQTIGFMARRLLSETGDNSKRGKSLVVASPLYVQSDNSWPLSLTNA